MLGKLYASPSVQYFNNYGAFVFITLAKSSGFFDGHRVYPSINRANLGEPLAHTSACKASLGEAKLHTSVSVADLGVLIPENINICVRRYETRLNGENFYAVSGCRSSHPYRQSSTRLSCNGSSSGDLSDSDENNPVPEPITPQQLPGIYVIICVENNKRYYGMSRNVSRRLSQHRSKLRRGIHEVPKLREDFKLYGEEKFEFGAVSHSLEQTDLQREANENQLIKDFIAIYGKDSCYNRFSNSSRKKDDNPFFGQKHTEETKKRISDSAKVGHKKRTPAGLPILLHGVVYPSISEASRVTNHSRDTIGRWLKNPNDTRCVWCNPNQQPNTTSGQAQKPETLLSKNTGSPKMVSIKGTTYSSISAAATALNCSRGYIQKLLRTQPDDCFILEE